MRWNLEQRLKNIRTVAEDALIIADGLFSSAEVAMTDEEVGRFDDLIADLKAIEEWATVEDEDGD